MLQGQSVALVTSGADGPTHDAVVGLLQQAGATVTGTVALTPAVTDPARADQLRQLTGTLLPAGAQLPAAADTGSLLGGLLGGVLTGPSGKAPVTGPQAEGVLSGLSAAGFTAAGRSARGRRASCSCSPAARSAGVDAGDGAAVVTRMAAQLDHAGRRCRAGGLGGLGRRHRRGRRRTGGPHRHGGAVHRRQRRDRRGPDQHRAGAARAGRRARGPLRHGQRRPPTAPSPRT